MFWNILGSLLYHCQYLFTHVLVFPVHILSPSSPLKSQSLNQKNLIIYHSLAILSNHPATVFHLPPDFPKQCYPLVTVLPFPLSLFWSHHSIETILVNALETLKPWNIACLNFPLPHLNNFSLGDYLEDCKVQCERFSNLLGIMSDSQELTAARVRPSRCVLCVSFGLHSLPLVIYVHDVLAEVGRKDLLQFLNKINALSYRLLSLLQKVSFIVYFMQVYKDLNYYNEWTHLYGWIQV